MVVWLYTVPHVIEKVIATMNGDIYQVDPAR